MQSKEVMKKLADNYETLVFVSKRYPSSMSRLKNLLMSEGVSETSARRKIADLETEAGCLVVERSTEKELKRMEAFRKAQAEIEKKNDAKAVSQKMLKVV